MFQKILVAAVLAASLVGCGTLMDSGDSVAKALSTITAAANLKYYYENGEAVEFVDNAELNEVETTQLLEALDQVERSKERLKEYEKSPERIILELDKIAFEYAKVKSAYLSVRSIVIENRSEYTDGEWNVFVNFEGAAKVLDEQFVELVEAAEGNAAVMTAFRLADTALKVAAVL